MRRLSFSIIPVVIVLLCVAGCPPASKDEEKEKPATPEEITKQGQDILDTIDRLNKVSIQELNSQLPQLRTKMQEYRQKHSNTKEGAQKIQEISSTIYGNANHLFNMEMYDLCITACDLVLVINPTHARAIELKGRAQEELNKPKVALKGFSEFIESGRLFAWIEVTYRTTGQKETKQVELGDEFAGYRVKKIDPERKEVVLRYTKTGSDVQLLLH